MTRPRLLVFIPTYNAAEKIGWVLSRIPHDLGEDWETEVLLIDDCSGDATTDVARRHLETEQLPYPVQLLANSRNQGYGGNQKLGYTYAVENGFDVVVMVHGDGQYPPEQIGELAAAAQDTGAAFGSRFLRPKGALSGGMPKYKFIGNRILTTVQNGLLDTDLSEFHSGFRAYRTDVLDRIPFEVNSSDFHFDTEIIIQVLRSGAEISEIDIPTFYGDEISHVNGLRYAKDVVLETLKSRIHDIGFLYERKYDIGNETPYEGKLDFDSPMTRAMDKIVPGSRIIDVGCADGHFARAMRARGCDVLGIDASEPESRAPFSEFHLHDLDEGLPEIEGVIDVVVMLDVIEHLRSPEEFVWELRDFCRDHHVQRVIVSTGNIAFLITRFALLLGQFNYGRRGILDMTHTRLFTFRSITKLFEQAGFRVIRREGIPAPFAMAVGKGPVATFLEWGSNLLMSVLPRLGAYQIMLELQPPAELVELLSEGETHAHRIRRIGADDDEVAEVRGA